MPTSNSGSADVASGPGSAMIRFTCDRREHATRTQRFTLTIHEGMWAFCPHEGATTEHQWRPIAGARLDTLLERLRPASAPRKR